MVESIFYNGTIYDFIVEGSSKLIITITIPLIYVNIILGLLFGTFLYLSMLDYFRYRFTKAVKRESK